MWESGVVKVLETVLAAAKADPASIEAVMIRHHPYSPMPWWNAAVCCRLPRSGSACPRRARCRP